MGNLLEIDGLEVLVLVDNATDSLSTNPSVATPEWVLLRQGGRLPILSGQATCHAHHGLSLLLSAHIGRERRTVLFDAGPEDATFLRNTQVLGVELGAIEAVVLSHGHWDHAGGLLAAVENISKARGSAQVDCLMHPDMFAPRAMRRPGGELIPFQPIPSPAELEKVGAKVVLTREPQSIAGGTFQVSGEIPRVTPYETGFPGHVRKSAGVESWEPDPLLVDERFLWVRVKDKGLVVFTACSHAGLNNVLLHAHSLAPGVPLYGVFGGLHLAGATEKIIPETVADLKALNPRLIAAGHCTGWRAMSAMAKAFGDELVPLAVGKRYVL